MAKLGHLFSNTGERNGWLVWMGLAHSQKHPLSAAVTVRIQLCLPGPNWARKKQRGLSLLCLDFGGLGSPREMLLVDLRAEPRSLSLHSRHAMDTGSQWQQVSQITFPRYCRGGD